MSSRFPVPLAVAASRLPLSPRSLESEARRKVLGLVDVPAPPSAAAGTVWLDADSVDAAVAARAAVRAARRIPRPPYQASPSQSQ